MTDEQLLKLSDFDFHLPDELIAQFPLEKRDESRLLVYQNSRIVDQNFQDLPDLLPRGSLVIVNNSKVIPSRLYGQTEYGGKVEIMLLESDDSCSHEEPIWKALGKPMKKLDVNQSIFFPDGMKLTVLAKKESKAGPYLEVAFHCNSMDLDDWLESYGHIPLPPYIKRTHPKPARLSPDKQRYQTVFAQDKGSVAAPTAGLHFTPEIFARLQEKEVEIAPLTLHVGAGTFLPVKTDHPDQHQMHVERFKIPNMTYQKIQDALAHQRSIIAVGTTSFRSLQAFHLKSQKAVPDRLLDRWLSTDLFIHPQLRSDRYQPWSIDALITNFHQPKSTLFMLICALIGFDEAHRLYRYGIEKKYRFFSYGDSTLLWI